MAKTKPRSGGSVAKSASRSTTKPSDPTIKPQNGSVENLRSEIQARFQIAESKSGKGKEKKKNFNGDSSQKVGRKNQIDSVESGRGKKRDHDGKVLKQPTKFSLGPDEPIEKEEGDDEDELMREVKALGGTTEDLELFADVDSDSELEGVPNDPPLKAGKSPVGSENLDKGMKNILKEIALAQGELSNDEGASNVSEEDDRTDDNTAIQEKASNLHQDQKLDKSARGRKVQFVCEPRPDWYNMPEPEAESDTPLKYTLSKDTLDQLHEDAKSLLDDENQKFKESQQSSSAQSFYNAVITSGTLSDKISALTLAVQESPIHNMRALETLIGLARKRSRSQAVDVLRALKDLFAQGSLLPESRKLYAFQAQPALPYLFGNTKSWKRGNKLPRGLEKQHLVSWAFESWLKEQYFEVLKVIEVWCNDEIEFSKARAVSYVYELLKERPEQESNLLRLLINKLGDPVKKIASQASYLLMQLLIAHPAMKGVVVSAIEADFIFRPGQNLHGKYYAVVTLNQTALSSKEEAVAVKLLNIYFGLFTGLLKPDNTPPKDSEETTLPHGRRGRRDKKPRVPGQAQAEELREKLISAILTGVNRAYPYTGSSGTSFSDHLETLFKITHSSNFNTSIQAMMLIQQLSTTHKASNDRFYRVLYESMLDPRLIIASKQQLYLNLLHRSLKADLNVKRVKAFVKRLLQILSLHDSSFICGSFFLIQDLESTFPSLSGLIDQPEDHDTGEEVFRDVDEDGVDTVKVVEEMPQGNIYDGHKRTPEHANADNSCAWEVLPFLAHFHPSVSVSADHVLRSGKLPGKPDLSLHTLSHFLDRFVYRNPKLSSAGLRGSSIMQPMAASDSQNVLISSTLEGQRRLPVNSETFKSKKGEDVAAEDVFFHRYFESLGKGVGKKDKKKEKKKKKQQNEDGESEVDEDEDEVWRAMMESAPDLEGDDDMDEDLDLSELESELNASEGEGVGGSDNEGVDIDPAFFDDDDEDLINGDMDENEDPAAAGESDSDVSDFAGFDAELEEQQQSWKQKKGKKDKKDSADPKTKGKKSKRNLPTFASAANYAKMLEDDDDEDV